MHLVSDAGDPSEVLGVVFDTEPHLFLGHYCSGSLASGNDVFMFLPHDRWYLGFDFPYGYVPIECCPYCGERLKITKS